MDGAERLNEMEMTEKKLQTAVLKNKHKLSVFSSQHASSNEQIWLLVGFLPFTNKHEINIDVFFVIPEKIWRKIQQRKKSSFTATSIKWKIYRRQVKRNINPAENVDGNQNEMSQVSTRFIIKRIISLIFTAIKLDLDKEICIRSYGRNLTVFNESYWINCQHRKKWFTKIWRICVG